MALTVDAPRITVSSTGTGERRVLAYSDIDGKQDATVEVTEGFSQDVVRADKVTEFNPSSIEKATTTLPLSGSVDKASDAAEGQLPATRNVFFTASEPTFSGATDVSSANGFQFGWRAGDDGQISSLRLATPQEANDEARGIVEQAIMKMTSLPIVFPSEPIGQGATWTVESRVTGEATLLQTTTYTLNKLDGDTVELGVDVAQRPSLGALSFEGQAQGTELENKTLNVLDSSTKTSGSLTVDLHKPLPTAGDVAFDTKVVYGTDDSQLRVVQSSDTKLAFK